MSRKGKLIVAFGALFATLLFAGLWFGYTLVTSAMPRDVEPDPIIQGVNFVGVYVDDIESADAYYASSVNTQEVEITPLPPSGFLASLGGAAGDEGGASFSGKLIRSSNAQLLLMSSSARSEVGMSSGAVPVNGPGIAHVCFQVARRTDAHRKMLVAGGVPVGDANLVHLNPSNPVYYGYVADPQGIITEIEEVDIASLDLPQPPPNQYRIRHVSLATPDIDAMIAFYSVFLGGQEPRHTGWLTPVSGEAVDKVSGLEGSELEMAWFQIRNLELEIFQYHSHLPKPLSEPRPIDAAGYNMIVLDVSDLDQARERLLSAGGELLSGPEPFAGGEAIYGRDPDGNLLVMHKVAADSPFSAKNFADNGT